MNRTLYMTSRSPYARKVRIVLAEKKLATSLVEVDLANRSAEFLRVSPLGKVPTLIDEDGTVAFDSTVIVEYLDDRYRDLLLLGNDWTARLLNRSIEELADTVADHAVAAFRALSRSDEAGASTAVAAVQRALGALEQRAHEGGWPESFSVADAAVISALGYARFRLGDEIIAQCPALRARTEQYAMRPSVAETVIRA